MRYVVLDRDGKRVLETDDYDHALDLVGFERVPEVDRHAKNPNRIDQPLEDIGGGTEDENR